jgi:hypothetical protein
MSLLSLEAQADVQMQDYDGVNVEMLMRGKYERLQKVLRAREQNNEQERKLQKEMELQQMQQKYDKDPVLGGWTTMGGGSGGGGGGGGDGGVNLSNSMLLSSYFEDEFLSTKPQQQIEKKLVYDRLQSQLGYWGGLDDSVLSQVQDEKRERDAKVTKKHKDGKSGNKRSRVGMEYGLNTGRIGRTRGWKLMWRSRGW